MTQQAMDNKYTIEELLDTQGYFVYTNVGYSMMPLLRQKKDIIEIRKKGSGRCKKYDVVLYKRKNRYILHRILRVLPDGYIIAGDHNVYVEKDIKDDDILGIMTRVIRDGKPVTPDHLLYKIYVHIWCDAYPIRMRMLKFKWKAYRLLGKIKKKIINNMKRRSTNDN